MEKLFFRLVLLVAIALNLLAAINGQGPSQWFSAFAVAFLVGALAND